MDGGTNTSYPHLTRFFDQEKFWCPYPYSHLDVATTGHYCVCCRTPKFDYKLADVTFQDHFNSHDMRTLRTEFETGIPGDHAKKYCYKCLEYERMGLLSKRQRLVRNLQADIQFRRNEKLLHRLESTLERSLSDQVLHLDQMGFSLLDFQMFGNECNLLCLICGPGISSAIARRESRLGTYNGEIVINPVTSLSEDRRAFLYTELERILPNTNWLKIIGGEPSINKSVIEFLTRIGSTGACRDVVFQTTTNGTIVTDAWLDTFKYFNRRYISVSMDAYAELNDIQRVGSNFSVIDKHVSKYQSVLAYNELELVAATTSLTCSRIEELICYAKMKKVHLDISCVVLSPRPFFIGILPDQIKSQYIQKLERSPWRSQCVNIIESLKQNNEDLELFSSYLKKLHDYHSVTRILKYFPEYKPYL